MADTSVADKVVKAFDHNRYLVASVVVALVAIVFVGGCPAKTPSIMEPDKMVTGQELDREIAEATARFELMLKKAEIANADLDAQYALRAKALEFVGGIATVAAQGGNPFANPAAAVGGVIQLAALGLLADNRRKDKKIKANKTA